ncbi:hypothetical protein SCUP234_03122 [Seiridium cupressi]
MDRMAQADPTVYSTLNALKQAPRLKHKSYFEIAENADKKAKKLETQVTNDRVPPPGYEFIALGNPELTAICKDLSREQDAMVFIVSESMDQSVHSQTHRLGFHFRERIVDQARKDLLLDGLNKPQKIAVSGRPEAIPSDRYQMMKDADAVLRDLFPRIPNTSRVEILNHSFDKDNKYFNGKEKVGMAEDLSLARRVQLAALSHIRHTMTRYDDLLKEGQKWENARKAVEKPCLDTIVKWRGDEETGRDQLDEILREVIEISDDEDTEDDTSEEEAAHRFSRARTREGMQPTTARVRVIVQEAIPPPGVAAARTPRREPSVVSLTSPVQPRKLTRKERKAAKQTQQRFKRYAQVAQTFRHEPEAPMSPRDGHRSDDVPDSGMPGSRHPELLREPGREFVPSSGAPPFEGERSYHDGSYGPPRPRGQSPVFIRVADHNGPKVGPTAGRQSHGGPIPLSPMRSQFQDLLVPSIEPRSPDVIRNHEQRSSYFSKETNQMNGLPPAHPRTMIEQPVGRPPHVFSSYVPAAEDMSSKRRRVISQPDSHLDLFSGAGFIQVHREPERHVAPVPREYYARSRSPPVYVPETANGNSGAVVYRSRTNPVYVDERAANDRDQAALRSREHPIILDAPRQGSRMVDTRQYRGVPDYGQRSHGRPEVLHEIPVQEIRRVSGRPQVIYMEEPDPRLVRMREYPVGRRSPRLVPVESRPEIRSSETLPYRNNPVEASQDPHQYTRHGEPPILHYRDTTRHAPLIEHPAPRVSLAPTHPGDHSGEVRYDHRQHEHTIIREAGQDQQGLAQQTYPNPSHPARPVSYY